MRAPSSDKVERYQPDQWHIRGAFALEAEDMQRQIKTAFDSII